MTPNRMAEAVTNDVVRGVAGVGVRAAGEARGCVRFLNDWIDAVENARGFTEEPVDETS